MFSNRGRASLDCLCFVFLLHCALYWFEICDCSISWSYPLFVAVVGGGVFAVGSTDSELFNRPRYKKNRLKG